MSGADFFDDEIINIAELGSIHISMGYSLKMNLKAFQSTARECPRSILAVMYSLTASPKFRARQYCVFYVFRERPSSDV
jgi:hypothetical protein